MPPLPRPLLACALLLVPAAPAAQAGGARDDVTTIRPTADKPFHAPKGDKARKRLADAVNIYMELPPDKVRAHPAAVDFPGTAAPGAEHVSRTVSVHGTGARCPVECAYGGCDPWEHWQSTGLYALPGEVVTLRADGPIPQDAVVEVIVGCHADELFDCEDEDDGGPPRKLWRRFPKISRRFPMSEPVLKVANAFGGQVFVSVRPQPGATEAPQCRLNLKIEGAVAEPFFELGKTTPEEWKKLRDAPAPWGELAGRKMILHVPSADLRKMEDPAPLLRLLDQVVAAEDTLAGWPEKRAGAERMVPDRQISAGWMHSGYPFMANLESLPNFLAFEKFKQEGDWGFFHELGHNHQSAAWTFDKPMDQGEVTVNLFSLYCMEHICRLPRGAGHDTLEGNQLLESLDRRFGAKPSDDPFDQLAPFVVLLHAYGWKPLEETLASYQTKPVAEDTPEPARQAEFILRYSHAARADLSAFFGKMGYACPDACKEALRELPPFDFGKWKEDFKAGRTKDAK